MITGGLRRRWANKPLNTFTDALEAFRTAISFRFLKWLNQNWDVFSAYKASLSCLAFKLHTSIFVGKASNFLPLSSSPHRTL
jgi:hypothetical protein